MGIIILPKNKELAELPKASQQYIEGLVWELTKALAYVEQVKEAAWACCDFEMMAELEGRLEAKEGSKDNEQASR